MATGTMLAWVMPNRECDLRAIAPQRLTIVPGETILSLFDFSSVLPTGSLIATVDTNTDETTGYMTGLSVPTGIETEIDFTLVVPLAEPQADVMLTITVTDTTGNVITGQGVLLVRP